MLTADDRRAISVTLWRSGDYDLAARFDRWRGAAELHDQQNDMLNQLDTEHMRFFTHTKMNIAA
jgi:hypothetical protein